MASIWLRTCCSTSSMPPTRAGSPSSCSRPRSRATAAPARAVAHAR